MNKLSFFVILFAIVNQLSAQDSFNTVLPYSGNVNFMPISKVSSADFCINSGSNCKLNVSFSLDSIQIAPKETSKCKKWLKPAIVPATLITAGVITTLVPDDSPISKYTIQENIVERFPDFHSSFDNYMQFVPLVAVFGLKVAGVKSRNDLLNQALITAKSELLMSAIVYSLKNITQVERPDGSSNTSMPSGHTAQAFLSATILDMEYRDISPWISVGGYAMATATAFGRMVNNRHWISDVLVGAGIGIFSVKVVYLTHQHKWDQKSNAVVVPVVYQKGGGMAFAMQF